MCTSIHSKNSSKSPETICKHALKAALVSLFGTLCSYYVAACCMWNDPAMTAELIYNDVLPPFKPVHP